MTTGITPFDLLRGTIPWQGTRIVKCAPTKQKNKYIHIYILCIYIYMVLIEMSTTLTETRAFMMLYVFLFGGVVNFVGRSSERCVETTGIRFYQQVVLVDG